MKKCEACGKPISDGVAWYSLRMFGNELCQACQIDRKKQEHMDKVEDQKFSWGEERSHI